jgi:hypothetical protein
MRVVLNLAIAGCLFALAGVNLAFNPFAPQAFAQAESPCSSPQPSENCECCPDQQVWVCSESL